ncbi:MAG: glutamate-5-semialdehyde dehydrogenase [Clostridiales bacterium]|nr:glutamate-5-semialdehyde dehydrogenase [Clostridiales bacterium]
MTTKEILEKAVNSKAEIKSLTTEKKDCALLKMADMLERKADCVIEANLIDLKDAEGKISSVMLDRLSLNRERIENMAQGIRSVAKLPDPAGRVLKETVKPNGLIIRKTAVPMGVIGIIYESRPNVTSDAAALCFKSGNACVLRGGKEAYRTSKEIVSILRDALEKCGINPDVIQIIDDTTRQSANEMMTAKGQIDLLIPRGGKGLIKACTENATVPCIETGTGICHIYVDDEADIEKALKIIDNAKTQRPSVCNACEVCLVNEKIIDTFLPFLYERLTENREHPVKFIVSENISHIIPCTKADETSFNTEFLDYILAVKSVKDIDEAINHIEKHSTRHSEAIITENSEKASQFLSRIDSAAVYVNASTRFTDGGEFGLGCEMGISTQKLHARGPMGLEELETVQYRIIGSGQIR